jgi:hypothetical protein
MCTLHNMSCPPRTKAQMQGRPISPRVMVFSLLYALSESGFVDAVPNCLRTTDKIDNSPGLFKNWVQNHWREPQNLFEDIGEPTFLDVNVDFLIGWTTYQEHQALPLIFCTDPCLCAGVQSRCAGTLYLSRRTPDLTWERLLRAPIAFDDPLVSIP